MSYYLFTRPELLQKSKDSYYNCRGKERTAKYYLRNKSVIKENGSNKYKHLSEEEREAKRKYGRNR